MPHLTISELSSSQTSHFLSLEEEEVFFGVMALGVSSFVRDLNGYKDDRMVGNDSAGGNSMALITRDLLGGGGSGGSATRIESQELDLDLHVPNGWEKCLDLKSGKVYLQRCNSSNSPSSSLDHGRNYQHNQTVPMTKLHDLNFPPSPSSKTTLNLFDDGSLEHKLVSSSPPPSSSSYQSVCTLDKVKSALERMETEPTKKRSSLWKASLSPKSYSSSSSSIRELQEDDQSNEKAVPSSPVAAGCPGCLSYVLIMKNNPKCPRCSSVVPMPVVKKPRIDLNMSI